jgi:superfamily I DNA/RNA helicase
VKLTLFEGEAGSGKTFSLATTLTSHIESTSLGEGQKVLALTFMHGSRRRLQSRLQLVPGLRQRFTCCTFDRLAWQITHRWRSLAKVVFGSIPGEADGYEITCRMAAALLNRDDVSRWVATTYPVVVIDEMQDVRGDRLVMIQALARFATVIAAADEFQDLNGGEDGNEGIEWMRANATVHSLTTNRRTTSTALLAAAAAIRSGGDVKSGSDFRFAAVPTHHLAAAYAALQLATRGTQDVVFVVPTGPGKAPFVKDTIDKLAAGPIHLKTQNRNVGPFSIMWESGTNEEEAMVAAAIDLPDDRDMIVNINDLRFDSAIAGVSALFEALRRQHALTGLTVCPVSEIWIEIKKAVHRTRSFRTRDGTRLRAMTVHQAKNREFRGVIILWPYQVFGSSDKLRRLLYNATTRAREWAFVLAQGNPIRIASPPFTSSVRPLAVAAKTARAHRRQT